jgi:hypothetical protein
MCLARDPTAPVWADAVEVLLGLGELAERDLFGRSSFKRVPDARYQSTGLVLI